MDRTRYDRLRRKASYFSLRFPREHRDDLIAVAVIAVWQHAPDPPFEANVMLQAMIGYLRSWNGKTGRKRTFPLPDNDRAGPDPYEIVDAIAAAASIRAQLSTMFPPRTVAILTAEADGTNLQALAEREGVTGSAFSYLRTSARRRLARSPTMTARLVA